MNPVLTFFVIREKSTGFMLPPGRYSHTRAEPANPVLHPPRLFTKAHVAQAALRCWLQGVWREDYSYSYDDWQGGSPEFCGHKIEPRSRDPKDFEVVPLLVSVLPSQAEAVEMLGL